MPIQRGRRLPFVVLPWAVLEHRSLNATDILVYCTIARFADSQTGQAYPSRATIASLARCSTATIDRSIKVLVKHGFLSKQARRTKAGDPDSNLYVVHEIAEAKGGVASPVQPGTPTSDDWGGLTSDDLTRSIELEAADPAEWTDPPADVKARMAELYAKGGNR